LGRILIGRVHQGVAKKGQKVAIVGKLGKSFLIEKLFSLKGLKRIEIDSAIAGDIISFSGIPEAKIGQTVAIPEETEALPLITVGEPTLHLTLGPNTSPLVGKEGKFVTNRQIEERLMKELEKNLSLRVDKKRNGKFKISGRGELHLAVFLENMRREGYEVEVGKPEVIIKEIDGVEQEPVEELDIIIPQEYVGVINQELGKRFAQLIKMESINEKEVEFIYQIPTRALLGLRSLLLTLTKVQFFLVLR